MGSYQPTQQLCDGHASLVGSRVGHKWRPPHYFCYFCQRPPSLPLTESPTAVVLGLMTFRHPILGSSCTLLPKGVPETDYKKSSLNSVVFRTQGACCGSPSVFICTLFCSSLKSLTGQVAGGCQRHLLPPA